MPAGLPVNSAGQALSANSLPVVVASDQPTIPVRIAETVAAGQPTLPSTAVPGQDGNVTDRLVLAAIQELTAVLREFMYVICSNIHP